MSVRIGKQRLQTLVNRVWETHPGGEVPEVGQAEYTWGTLTAVRLYTSETIHLDAAVRGREHDRVEVEVHRRSASLTWGREVFTQERLQETALAFQRAALLLGLVEAKR